MAESKHAPVWYNFIIGGVSGMLATCVVYPMDSMKARMQSVIGPAVKKSKLLVAQSIVSREGISGFYTGMSVALYRQGIYSACRFGCFNSIMDAHHDIYGVPSFKTKIGIGMLSGGVSAFIGIPAEVARIRQMADGHLPVGFRRNYKSFLDAIVRIPREEGINTLWRGALPRISKSMLVNGAQLATYAQTRQVLLMVFNDSIYVHFSSSVFASLATTFASLPINVVRNRLQKAEKGTSHAWVLLKMFYKEGTGSLWNGFLPAFARTGPNIMLTFIFLQQLDNLYLRIME